MFEKWKLPSPSMAVAWLALAVALGGTAVAATVTLVKITDNSGTRVAGVDAQGRLRTAAVPMAPSNTFTAFNYLGSTTATRVLGPTQATLVLSTISIGNYFDQLGSAKIRAVVHRYESSAANCTSYVTSRVIGTYYVAPGQTFHASFPAGVTLKPQTNGNYVCLTALVTIQGGLSSYYMPEISVTGWVESGSYVAQIATSASASADEGDGAPRRSR